jgi:hypothetical protein
MIFTGALRVSATPFELIPWLNTEQWTEDFEDIPHLPDPYFGYNISSLELLLQLIKASRCRNINVAKGILCILCCGKEGVESLRVRHPEAYIQ